MTDQSQVEALIARAGLKDRHAFTSLYDVTSAKLFSVCLQVLKDRQAAEDALQESYIKIWNNAGRYDANGLSPMTWLITIARNISIDRLRTHRSNHSSFDEMSELVDKTGDPEAHLLLMGENKRIADCLEELERDKAEAVRGAYLYGFSYAELASRYNIPLNTVRTWLRRSLLQLKGCLSNE